jgi:hypothetical protein
MLMVLSIEERVEGSRGQRLDPHCPRFRSAPDISEVRPIRAAASCHS